MNNFAGIKRPVSFVWQPSAQWTQAGYRIQADSAERGTYSVNEFGEHKLIPDKISIGLVYAQSVYEKDKSGTMVYNEEATQAATEKLAQAIVDAINAYEVKK